MPVREIILGDAPTTVETAATRPVYREIELGTVSSKPTNEDYNKKVALFYNWIKNAPPEEREGSAITRFANPLGLGKWLSRKFGTGDEAAWFDALDAYTDELPWTNPEKWKHFLVSAEQAALTFKGLGAVGVPGTVPKFAAYEAIQAPREDETLGQRAAAIGKGAAFGFAVGKAGKHIPKARFRIPTTMGGAMLVTAVGGGSAKQILDAGAQMFGWEVIGLAQQGADRIAVVKAARKFNPELSKVPAKEIVQNANQLADIHKALLTPTQKEAIKRHNEAVTKWISEGRKPEKKPVFPEGIIPTEPQIEKPPTVKREVLPVEKGLRLEPLREKIAPPKGEAKERGFITSIKEQFPELETRVSGQYIPRGTDPLAIRARNFVLDNPVAAERIARTGRTDPAGAVSSELIKHLSEKARTAKTKTESDAIYEKIGSVAHDSSANFTAAGQFVQSASILGRLTPEGQLRFAAQEINAYNKQVATKRGGLLGLRKRIPQLTPEQTKAILNRAKIIENMPDGPAKAEAFWKLQNYISELVPTPLYRKIINIWKAGLLTGIKTTDINTFANISHGVTEMVKDVPAVAVDRVTSLFTGRNRVALTGRGVKGGIFEGFGKGWKYLRTGYSERDIGAKLEYKKVNFGKSRIAKILQGYEEFVFRAMGAEDQPFYYGAKARSLQSQAIAEAKNQRLKGTKAKKFVENLVTNPTDEMLKYAVIDAETAVFQNRTSLGDLARAIQKIPGGEIVVPFGRTPSAVAMQIVNYSPVGAVKTIAENVGRGRFDQRMFSLGMGRAMTGTAAIYIGAQLFKNGLVTLDRPKSEREQKLWELEGRQPNSIRIGGKWRQVPALGPLGSSLIIGGYFQRAFDESGSPTKAIITAWAGGASSFLDQTFVRGMNQAIEALTDPQRSFETFFSSLTGSIVPTIVADIARAKDVVERRAVGPLQRIALRIPGLRERLQPKVNVFGQDLPRYGGNVLEVMADPTRPSKIKQDVVVDELRRLWDKKVRVAPTLLGDKNGYEGLTPEQNTKLWEQTGRMLYPLLFNAIHTSVYKKADDEQKGKFIETLTNNIKNVSRAAIAVEATKTLSGEAKLTKLRELRASGLLTNDVMQIYVGID